MPTVPAVAPFAALEARVNRSVADRLSNVFVTYSLAGAAYIFGALLNQSGDDPFDGAVDATARSLTFDSVNTPALAKGSELVIDGITYVVSSGVQPDASGWVNLTVYPKGP